MKVSLVYRCESNYWVAEQEKVVNGSQGLNL
jgi:hypothetical protein